MLVAIGVNGRLAAMSWDLYRFAAITDASENKAATAKTILQIAEPGLAAPIASISVLPPMALGGRPTDYLGRFDFQSDRVISLDARAVKDNRLLGIARQRLAVGKYRSRRAILFANSFINDALLQIGDLLVCALFDGALDECQGYR